MKPLTILIHCLGVSVLLLLPGIAFAQISITSNDAFALIGSSQVVETDTSGSMAINVGSAGANQSWDLTGVSVQGYNVSNHFITPQGTPFETDFPSANFVNSITDSSGNGGIGEIIIYNYMEVTPSQYATLGGGLEIPGLDTSYVLYESDDVAPLPLTYNSQWISTESDTFGDPAIFAIIDLDTTLNNVDGWGTLQLPIGNFNCLRIRANNRYTELTVIGGQIQSVSITNTIAYTWLSKDNFILAEAESQDNDINPNFTTAADFQRLVSVSTGIDDRPQVSNPQSFRLFQNYPNPFNPATTINYHLSSASEVELQIYDHLGRQIKTLVQKQQPAGDYQVSWDGRNNKNSLASSGVYFYHLKAGSYTETRKMILLR